MKPSKSHEPEGRLVKLSGMVEKTKTRRSTIKLSCDGTLCFTPEIFEMLETQVEGAVEKSN